MNPPQIFMSGYPQYEYFHTLATKFIVIMSKQVNFKPTEGELEILSVLWNKGASTVRTVNEELCKTKDTGYTTTLKLMQIMFDKGLVTRDSSSKTHVYEAAVSREKTQSQFVDKMINSLFAGSGAELVMHALGGHKPSSNELNKIQDLIDRLKKG